MKPATRLFWFTFLFASLLGCQPQPAPENSPAASSTEIVSASETTEPVIIISDETPKAEWVACPEKRPEVCTQIYQPVCGSIDTGVRCVTTPCPSQTTHTFGNACTACTDVRVMGYLSGECSVETEAATE